MKSNRTNQTPTNAANSVTQSNETRVPNRSSLSSDNPKGILRDRNFGEMYFKPPTFENSDIKNFDEDDKKSVRYFDSTSNKTPSLCNYY